MAKKTRALDGLKSEWKLDDELTFVEALHKLVEVRREIADLLMADKMESVRQEKPMSPEAVQLNELYVHVSDQIEALDKLMGVVNFLEREPSLNSLSEYFVKSS